MSAKRAAAPTVPLKDNRTDVPGTPPEGGPKSDCVARVGQELLDVQAELAIVMRAITDIVISSYNRSLDAKIAIENIEAWSMEALQHARDAQCALESAISLNQEAVPS